MLVVVSSSKMGAPVRTLDGDERQRLAAVRKQAVAGWLDLRKAGPKDALGALAWLAGIEGKTPNDPAEMVKRLDRARREKFTWREIADALGEGDTPAAARRVRDRRKVWES